MNVLGLWMNNNNSNGNFYKALPTKNFTVQGAYKSDTNNNNITHTHTQTQTHTHIHTHTNTDTHTHTHRHTHTHTDTHTHTHIYTHTQTHTPSLKNYMPPKYTYQKAENQAILASFALAHSLAQSLYLSLSLLAHTQEQVTCSFTGGKVG